MLFSTAAVALSTWQAGLSRDSGAAHRSIELIGVVALVAMVVLGRSRQRQTIGHWSAGMFHFLWRWRTEPRTSTISRLMWCGLIAGVVGWDLLSFAVQSSSFPTLSTLVGHITRYPLGRGLLFATWLVVGAYTAAGWRAETRR